MIGSTTNLEFVKQWYRPEEIHRSINNPPAGGFSIDNKIPEDTKSIEFAKWLADQYQLAMLKGMDLMERELESRKEST